jgi:glycosyltransferase involved in cell wall biosynthesis
LKTAFIVLTYNGVDALLPVLRGLATQCNEHHEVIIADDGSGPAAVEALRKALPAFNCPVRHVWHPDVGFTASRARNLAANNSQSDYLVFMDGDCIPNAHFVQAHAELAEVGCFVNGSRVLLSERFTKRIVANGLDIGRARWFDQLRWRLAGDVNKLIHLLPWPKNLWRKETSFRWKQIRSCNFGVWRSDFLRVNGFDETFQGWGHEDADLVLRLHNAGLKRKNGFCATEVYHLWHLENSRVSESENRNRVKQRMQTGVIRATAGVADAMGAMDVCVTRLNSVN